MLSFEAPDSRPLSMTSPNAVMADACDCEFLSRKVLLTIIEGTFERLWRSNGSESSGRAAWVGRWESDDMDARDDAGASGSFADVDVTGADTKGAAAAGGASTRAVGGPGGAELKRAPCAEEWAGRLAGARGAGAVERTVDGAPPSVGIGCASTAGCCSMGPATMGMAAAVGIGSGADDACGTFGASEA